MIDNINKKFPTKVEPVKTEEVEDDSDEEEEEEKGEKKSSKGADK